MSPAHRFAAMRVAYVAVLLLATLKGLKFSPDVSLASDNLRRALALQLHWGDAIDAIRNVVLFAGFGAVWIITTMRTRIVPEIRRATLFGFLISATVESLQAFSTVRAAALTDLFTNTAGAFLGAFVTAEFIVAVTRAKGAKSYIGVPAFVIAGGYGVAALAEALTPLFYSNEFQGIPGGPFVLLRVALNASTPLSFDAVQFTNLLLFGAAGFLTIMYTSESGRVRRNLVAAVGAVVILGAHVSHGLFGLPIRWEVVGVDAIGFVLGAFAGAKWLSPLSQLLRGPLRARALLVAYLIVLSAWAWRPFFPEWDASMIKAQLIREHFIPLASLAMRGDVFSAVHVGQIFFLYIPLGAMLAVWPFRSRGPWSGCWPGVYVAAIAELGRLFVAGRTFDVTNTLIACAGLGIGWIVVRRSGYTPYGEAMAAVQTPRSRTSATKQ